MQFKSLRIVWIKKYSKNAQHVFEKTQKAGNFIRKSIELNEIKSMKIKIDPFRNNENCLCTYFANKYTVQDN